MVLIRTFLVAFVAMSMAFGLNGAGEAHKNHNKVEAAQGAPTPSRAVQPAAMADHGDMEMAETPPRAMPERAVAWLGKMHPAAVHFPIALFPAAFVLLAFGRQREGVAAVARGLIIFAGLAAAAAALMGWISAGFAMGDADPVQAWHRWIGTGIAAVGLLAAFLAWRRRDTIASGTMVMLTGVISLAILVQGGLGGILTHGLEHMRF